MTMLFLFCFAAMVGFSIVTSWLSVKVFQSLAENAPEKYVALGSPTYRYFINEILLRPEVAIFLFSNSCEKLFEENALRRDLTRLKIALSCYLMSALSLPVSWLVVAIDIAPK
jgi:hypothetical protein